jgi:hypothetical protein
VAAAANGVTVSERFGHRSPASPRSAYGLAVKRLPPAAADQFRAILGPPQAGTR